jgi:hypothetical protein
MPCTKHLLQQSAVGRRWRSACGTVGGQNDNRQTNPACERHSRSLKTVPCADYTAGCNGWRGLASWLRAMTCCWQRQKLPHVLRRPSSKCDFAVGSFRLKASMLDGGGPCPTSYNWEKSRKTSDKVSKQRETLIEVRAVMTTVKLATT